MYDNQSLKEIHHVKDLEQFVNVHQEDFMRSIRYTYLKDEPKIYIIWMPWDQIQSIVRTIISHFGCASHTTLRERAPGKWSEYLNNFTDYEMIRIGQDVIILAYPARKNSEARYLFYNLSDTPGPLIPEHAYAYAGEIMKRDNG